MKVSCVGHDLAAMKRDADAMNMVNHIPASRVAVFIDGDNVAPKYIASVRAQAELLGSFDVLRVYADVTHVPGWRDTPGVMLAPVASGKNASDIALCIDALELALNSDIGTFLIASGDQGYAHLAQRLRAHGKQVVGACGGRPSPFFRDSCNAFRELSVDLTPEQTRKLHSKIFGVLGRQPTQPMPLAVFGSAMRDVGVTKGDFPHATWRAFLADHADRYTLCDKGVRQNVELTGQQWLNRHATPKAGRQ